MNEGLPWVSKTQKLGSSGGDPPLERGLSLPTWGGCFGQCFRAGLHWEIDQGIAQWAGSMPA